jgi:hypothetical protein
LLKNTADEWEPKMVARLKVTTTIGSDGTLRLAEDEIEGAGLRPGDLVDVQVVKVETPDAATRRAYVPEEIDLDNLPHWTADDLFERFRIDEPIDVEEAIKQGEEDAADEFVEEYKRSLKRNG